MKVMNDLRVSVMPCSATPLLFDETKCIGRNSCCNICQCDIMMPNPEKGKQPHRCLPRRVLVLWRGR